MKKFIFVIMVLSVVVYAKAGWLGDLPTPHQLKMTKEDYAFMSALAGLMCGSIFSFLITR